MLDKIDITNQQALEYAQEFLGGQWLKLTPDDLKLSVCGGGYCSRLYLCQNVSENNNASNCSPTKEYSKFLIRLCSGKVLEDDSPIVVLSREAQTLFYYHMGVKSQGPKLLGAFKGGRLEEFIESHTLTPEDMLIGPDGGAEIRGQIARRLAVYHHVYQDIPLSSKRIDHYAIFEGWYSIYDAESFERQCKSFGFATKWISQYDGKKEIEWLKSVEPKIQTRDVMSNNDMKMDNCLVRKEPDEFGEQIVLIDYEISSMNSRGNDIGHHFAMWTVDFTKKGSTFMSDYEYPSEEIRRQFITEYLNETKRIAKYELNDELDTVDHIMMESDFFGLKIIHFWISMGMMRAPDDSAFNDPLSRLGFVSLAYTFANQYLERKKLFLEKYQKDL